MKPEFMRLRRALAGILAALLMAVGIVVLSPALSASAHHNTISVDVSCVNYQWKVTWKITNSQYQEWEKITYSSNESIIAKDTVIDRNSTYIASEIVSVPVQKTLSVKAIWSNDVKNSNSKTLYKSAFEGTCEKPDTPTISVTGSTCAEPSRSSGTVTFSLSGATKSYTVTLLDGSTVKATTSSSGGTGTFDNVPPGTYTVKASSAYATATSGPITVSLCATQTPAVDLVIEPCIAGGSLGAITANLSSLSVGSQYTVALLNSAGLALETLPLTATATTFTKAFASNGPGEFSVELYDAAGNLLSASADATIDDCTPEFAITVQLEPCVALQTGNAREISVDVEGMEASTVYTVRLVTADAAATEVASTTTAGDDATTFTHTFTGVPGPGQYRVLVAGGTDSLESETITATICQLPDLAPPSIELLADQCDGSGTGIDALSARMIDLDATRTYYVRIVDAAGTTVPGGEDRTVGGSTTATVEFPDVTAGTYTAQLLIDPDKQLAATSPASIDYDLCLPTLAMTGPGALVPLGGVAALLLTLGGAVVLGRLRRRMAL